MKAIVLTTTVAMALVSGAAIVLAQPAEPTFEGLDQNHDGMLSKDEIEGMFAQRRGAGGRHHHSGSGGGFGGGPNGSAAGGFGHGVHGGRSPGQGAAERRSGRPNVDQVFKSWDTDGYGSISREEFDARPRFGGGRRGGAGGAQGDLPSL